MQQLGQLDMQTSLQYRRAHQEFQQSCICSYQPFCDNFLKGIGEVLVESTKFKYAHAMPLHMYPSVTDYLAPMVTCPLAPDDPFPQPCSTEHIMQCWVVADQGLAWFHTRSFFTHILAWIYSSPLPVKNDG